MTRNERVMLIVVIGAAASLLAKLSSPRPTDFDLGPFAFWVGTRGALGGVALGVGIGVAYWAIAALLETMGAVGQLPPFLAGWSPDIIFFFLGMYFFFKMPT